MTDLSLLEAFGRYQAKPAVRARSAVKKDKTLVLSCWYARFHKAEADVLRYEEDLSSDTGAGANALRAHLAEALAQDYGIRLIVATAPSTSERATTDLKAADRPTKTTFHPRKDLLGRITFYDGHRFIIEFRKHADAA